jgi:hypothetical protein
MWATWLGGTPDSEGEFDRIILAHHHNLARDWMGILRAQASRCFPPLPFQSTRRTQAVPGALLFTVQEIKKAKWKEKTNEGQEGEESQASIPRDRLQRWRGGQQLSPRMLSVPWSARGQVIWRAAAARGVPRESPDGLRRPWVLF